MNTYRHYISKTDFQFRCTSVWATIVTRRETFTTRPTTPKKHFHQSTNYHDKKLAQNMRHNRVCAVF